MAIRKVSRLQHRRGLKSDLPNKLYEAEIGYCLDTRELFIGNSDAAPGNSQILTEWTPNDAVITHSYKGNTGVPASTITRTLGAKLDDFINVRDYGASGNGILDDIVPLQLAITDCYNRAVANGFDQLQSFVTIRIPAGKYKITEPLRIYPYVKLQGEGSQRTVIILDNDGVTFVAQTVDSNGNESTNIGSNNAVIPENIDIQGITFIQPKLDSDGLWLDRCSTVRLQDVTIKGPFQYNTETVTAGAGISIRSYGTTPALIPARITLEQVEITGFDSGINSNDPIRDLHLLNCYIHDLGRGITLGEVALLGGPTMTKIKNSVFRNIEQHALFQNGDNLGVITSGNTFDTIGVITHKSAIIWGEQTQGCSSIGDQFKDIGYKFVENLNPELNNSLSPQKVSISTSSPDFIGPMTLFNNHPVVALSTSLSYDLTLYNTIILSYTLSRGTNKRIGTITILSNNTNAILQDDFNTLGVDLGVTFAYKILSGVITLTYKTTNTGTNAIMYYTESKWFT